MKEELAMVKDLPTKDVGPLRMGFADPSGHVCHACLIWLALRIKDALALGQVLS